MQECLALSSSVAADSADQENAGVFTHCSSLTPSSLSFCSYKYVSSSYTDPPDQLADTNQEEDVPGERDLINFDKFFLET